MAGSGFAADDPAAVEETDDGAQRLIRRRFVNFARFARVEGICLRAAELPVVVEGRLVVAARGADIDIRQAEFAARSWVLPPGIHHAHMRHERAGLIEAGELHAVTIILEAAEQRARDAARWSNR